MEGRPQFDIELPEPRVESTPRWVRVRAGDTWLADSREALLLAWYGPGRLPTYCFPPRSGRTDLLHPSSGTGEEGLLSGATTSASGAKSSKARPTSSPIPPSRCQRSTALGRSPGMADCPDSRRRSRYTCTRVTPRSASTPSRASATCGSRSQANSSPSRCGPTPSLRRDCLPDGISLARMCVKSCLNPRRRPPSAP